jgi:DHA1 family multidrug resistance protein-like MFS transporter
MKELIRDTVLGHVVRVATKGKVLPFQEEHNPSCWKLYVDHEKSGQMAHHGYIGDEQQNEEGGERQARPVQTISQESRDSSGTRLGSQGGRRNEASGVLVDPEKGKDVAIVTWLTDDDPEVCSLPHFE